MLIKRDAYLQKLIKYQNKDLIKVITGVRRSGKSVLLFELFNQHLLKNGIKKEQIIKLNLEDKKNFTLRNSDALYNYIQKRMDRKKKTYVLLDEIQYIDGFEEVVNSLKLRGADIYLTGSNSKMLSGEINTILRGRSIEIRVLPLSFREFFSVSKLGKEDAFNEYLRYGGFPYVATEKDEALKVDYLKMLASTMATKDIIERKKIKNVAAFQAVYDFLISNIGSVVSVKKITDTLKSNGFNKLTVDTVGNYLEYLCDAFLFSKVYRFDVKGKAYLKTLNKYYATDLGLCFAPHNFRQVEVTHALENLVYNELISRGYAVDIGKNQNKEIDFVAVNEKETLYIQVAYTMALPEKRQQELGSFKGLADAYPKLVLTMDNDPFDDLGNGYKKLNVIKWLLES